MKFRLIQITLLIVMFFVQCRLELFNAGDTRSDAFRKTQLLRCLLGGCEVPFLNVIWKEVWRNPNANSINSGIFLNDQIGFLVGSRGLVMRTSNQGNSWNRLVASDTQFNINGIEINPVSKDIFIAGGRFDFTSTYLHSCQFRKKLEINSVGCIWDHHSDSFC
jgi:hypothetical protein